jgi:hypothetical protein
VPEFVRTPDEAFADLPVGFLVRGGCHSDPGEDVIAAYEAQEPVRSAIRAGSDAGSNPGSDAEARSS